MSSRHENQATYMESYWNGTVSADDIDDYVDSWQANPGAKEIYEFPGMSEEEYALWLRDPDVLPRSRPVGTQAACCGHRFRGAENGNCVAFLQRDKSRAPQTLAEAARKRTPD